MIQFQWRPLAIPQGTLELAASFVLSKERTSDGAFVHLC